MKVPIYMDCHATTRVDPRVLEAMLPYFSDRFGNAASRTHAFGWQAEEAVEQARAQIAAAIGAEDPREIVFTSGATESDNLALLGVVGAAGERGRHIITTSIEHKAVLDSCRVLERQGCRVTYLPVDRSGLISVEDLEHAIAPDTILIAVMWANNEIGVLQPIEEIGRLARRRGILFFSDATQAVGRIPVDVERANLDLMALSAHKMYGPKGCGALYVRRHRPRVRLSPLIYGGGHERGMRSGTLNVPGIVGFGRAAEIAALELPHEMPRLQALRDRLKEGMMRKIPQVGLNGDDTRRLPGNLNLSFSWIEGESLLMQLSRDVALSTGSACTSATLEPSHVLRALGLPDDLANASVRFGLGRFNTEAEVDYVIDRVAEAVVRLREMSPLYEVAQNLKKA